VVTICIGEIINDWWENAKKKSKLASAPNFCCRIRPASSNRSFVDRSSGFDIKDLKIVIVTCLHTYIIF
jgi:hypothetical protein